MKRSLLAMFVAFALIGADAANIYISHDDSGRFGCKLTDKHTTCSAKKQPNDVKNAKI